MGSIPPSGSYYAGNPTVLGSAYAANSATSQGYATVKAATAKSKPQQTPGLLDKLKNGAKSTFNFVCNTAGTVGQFAPMLAMLPNKA